MAREPLEHAESISYYVGNDSAEMATVLRIDATTLTRLRAKMEVQIGLESVCVCVCVCVCLIFGDTLFQTMDSKVCVCE